MTQCKGILDLLTTGGLISLPTVANPFTKRFLMLFPIPNCINKVSLCTFHCVSGDLFAPSASSFPTLVFFFVQLSWNFPVVIFSYQRLFNLCGCNCIKNICDLRAQTIYHIFLSVMNTSCLDYTDNALLQKYLVLSIEPRVHFTFDRGNIFIL